MNESNVVNIEGKTGTMRNPRASAMYVSTDEAMESDRAWFNSNKDCAYRIRESFIGELFTSEIGAMEEGTKAFVLVTQIAPGIRVQQFAPMPHNVDTENFDQIHIGVIAHLLGGDRYKRLMRSYENNRD